jgi:membrane protein required for colicin V production
MNYLLDHIPVIIILLCLGWGAYRGFKKGFIIQSFTILALILAIWAGFAFNIAPFIHRHFGFSGLASEVLSFVLIFILVLILVYTSGYLVSKVVNAVALGLINRLAGAIFGIFANVLVLSVIIFLFNKFTHDNRELHQQLKKSFLYEPVGKVAPAICPDSVKQLFKIE